MRGREPLLRVLGLLLAVGILLALQVAYWPYTVDDAYISYRYAENVAKGFGFVFNPGERVEGFTNFLWVVLLAAAHWLGANTVLVSKILGGAFGVATLGLCAKLWQRAGEGNPNVGIVAALILASSPAFALWSVAGLETSFFTFLIMASVLRFFKEQSSPQARPISALLMAACGMARPEGVLVFAIGLIAIVHRSIVERKVTKRDMIWCLLFLAVGLPYFAWRLYYFGYPLPNTFYAKTGRGLHQFMAGVLYTTSSIKNHGGLLFLLLAMVPVFRIGARREIRYLFALTLVWLVYNIYKGHDVLPLYRFIVPILPIWIVLSVAGLIAVLEAVAAQPPRFHLVRPFLAVFLIGTLGMNAVLFAISRSQHQRLSEYQVRIDMEASSFMPIAERLKEFGPPGSTIALIDAGAIPYVTGWYTIDRWGLLDEHIAHTKGRGPRGEKFDEKYVMSKRPTFIQTHITAEMEQKGMTQYGWPGDAELFSLPEFRENYVRVNDRLLEGFFVRKDVQLEILGTPISSP
jgi:arabinofuranosyltransferase